MTNEDKKELVRRLGGLQIAYMNSANEKDVNGQCGKERLFNYLMDMCGWLNDDDIMTKLWEEADDLH